jgi:hypothetical protein
MVSNAPYGANNIEVVSVDELLAQNEARPITKRNSIHETVTVRTSKSPGVV